MPNNLTLTSATFGAGKFGNALTGGSGLSAFYPSTTSFTLEIWFKTTSTAGNQVMFSIDGAYIGLDGSGRVIQGFNGAVSSATAFNDGVWHHMEVDVQPSSSVFYVDGNVVGSSSAASGIGSSKNLTIGRHQTFGFNWAGSLDEFASWNVVRHTAAFTPPASAYASGLAGMVQLYHFDGDGIDSVVATTAPATMVAPVAAAGNASATVTLTAPSDGGSAITGYTVTSSPAGGVDSNAGSQSLSHVMTGLTNGTVYTFTATATNGVGTSDASPASNSVTPASSQNNALTGATGNVLFSPYNWNVQASNAKTICSGSYFRVKFGGTSCSLQFDTSGLTAPYSKLEYRVDETGPFVTVDLAASVPISMPSETSTYQSHFLELNVRSSGRANRGTLGGMVALTGIILDAGKVLSLPPRYPLNILIQGDSISEAYLSLFGTGDAVAASNAMQSYATVAARYIGAEIGLMGFAGQGFSNPGDGGLPVYGSTYNTIYPGVAQTWLPAPDLMAMNMGTNDGTNNIVTQVTAVLNGWIAAAPSAKKVVMRPFNGNQGANLQAGIAACSAPSSIKYLNTAGYFDPANSPDALHPNGFEHVTHIGPAVGAEFKSILAAAPTLTARTVSVTLGTDASTPAANLTGLKVSYFDEATPDLHTVARYKTAAGTTNSSGVLSFSAQSTLAAGATGYLVVQGAGGVHYNAPVVVA